MNRAKNNTSFIRNLAMLYMIKMTKVKSGAEVESWKISIATFNLQLSTFMFVAILFMQLSLATFNFHFQFPKLKVFNFHESFMYLFFAGWSRFFIVFNLFLCIFIAVDRAFKGLSNGVLLGINYFRILEKVHDISFCS